MPEPRSATSSDTRRKEAKDELARRDRPTFGAEFEDSTVHQICGTVPKLQPSLLKALRSMPYEAPVEAGLVLLLARSVGDDEAVYRSQLRSTAGQTLVTPPTFVRALEHFNPQSTTRPHLPREIPEFGGSTNKVHVEQHFEYVAPFRQGELVTITTFPGGMWSKKGRSGRLDFTETTTEYCNAKGEVLVRARKVSVQIVAAEAP